MHALTHKPTRAVIFGGGLVALAIAFNAVNKHPVVPEVEVQAAKALIDAGAVVIDVREQDIAAASHIGGALIIPLGSLHTGMSQLTIAKTAPIVVYCNDGSRRGPEGTATLQKAGYSNAVNLKTGIEGWRAAGLPTSGG